MKLRFLRVFVQKSRRRPTGPLREIRWSFSFLFPPHVAELFIYYTSDPLPDHHHHHHLHNNNTSLVYITIDTQIILLQAVTFAADFQQASSHRPGLRLKSQ